MMTSNYAAPEATLDDAETAERITEIAGRLIEADPGLSPQDADRQAAAMIE